MPPALQLRTVNLHEGPFDGCQTIVSHFTAVFSGELYVWDGDVDRNHFVYAKNIPPRFTETEKEEFELANSWLDDIYAQRATEQPRVRAWLINLAIALRQYSHHEPGPEDPRSPEA
jgi:hypothetical protein